MPAFSVRDVRYQETNIVVKTLMNAFTEVLIKHLISYKIAANKCKH